LKEEDEVCSTDPISSLVVPIVNQLQQFLYLHMLDFHQRFGFLYKSVMLSFKTQPWFSKRVSPAPAPQPSVGSASAALLRERGGQLASAPPGPAAAAADQKYF
jgi:hypothetical protein